MVCELAHSGNGSGAYDDGNGYGPCYGSAASDVLQLPLFDLRASDGGAYLRFDETAGHDPRGFGVGFNEPLALDARSKDSLRAVKPWLAMHPYVYVSRTRPA